MNTEIIVLMMFMSHILAMATIISFISNGYADSIWFKDK